MRLQNVEINQIRNINDRTKQDQPKTKMPIQHQNTEQHIENHEIEVNKDKLHQNQRIKTIKYQNRIEGGR